MTEDYKNSIYRHFFGTPIFPPYPEYAIDLEDTITLGMQYNELWSNTNLYLLKNNDGEENGLILQVMKESMEVSGVTVSWSHFRIKKMDGTILTTIDYTTSGEKIPGISCLYIEDDGTIFIKTNGDSETFPNRLLMINNICNKVNDEYVFKIRKSYNISSYIESDFVTRKIVKSPLESKYVLVGYYPYRDGGQDVVKIKELECTINVGAENEYNVYELTNLLPQDGFKYYDIIVSWNSNGEHQSKILVGFTTYNIIDEYIKSFTSDEYTISFGIEVNDVSNREFIYTINSELMIGLYRDTSQRYIWFDYIMNTSSGAYLISEGVLASYEEGKSFYIGISPFSFANDRVYIPITKNDGKTYLIIYEAAYDSGVASVNKLCDEEIIGQINGAMYGTHPVMTNRIYMLRNIYSFINIQPNSQIFNFNCLHLMNQYTYDSYEQSGGYDYISSMGILRDSNNHILFARDLYNRIRQQNTITSTINVPNLMLNDVVIKKEQLISLANTVMDNISEDIEKNVYENLLINFNDIFTVIDDNNDEGIILQDSSNYIVRDIINKDIEWSGARIYKYRVVYQDNTSEVYELEDPTEDDENRISEYTISLYTKKETSRIELINWDEDAILFTIPFNVNVGNYYTIKQKVRVI